MKENQKSSTEFYSLAEAAEYAHISRQAIYMAIHKKQLRAEKKFFHGAKKQWIISKEAIDEYRSLKYNSDKRTFKGEKLFDLDNDRWSILHASKCIAQMLGRPYPMAHIYYLLRFGRISAKKRGGAWVLDKKTVMALYYSELRKQEQMELA